MWPTFTRVLVSTDFSAVAEAAIPYAYALAAPGGVVHLLHVIEHEEAPNPLYAHYVRDELYNPDKRREAVAEVERRLMALVPAEAAGRDIRSVPHCSLHERAAQAIVELAAGHDVDAIVMGSHGRGGLAHVLLGSVSEQVLRHGGRPLFLIPRPRA